MNRRLSWISLIVLVACASSVLAQTIVTTPKVSAPLDGRLFDVTLDRPMAGAHIFAVALKDKRVLAHATTNVEPGPDKGRWTLNGLPAEGEIILIGFHESAKENLWLQRYRLTGAYNDLSIVYTAVATTKIVAEPEQRDVWNHLQHAGWIPTKASAMPMNERASELTKALLATLEPPAKKTKKK